MINKKSKNLLKLGILLFGLSVFIISCQKDDDLKNIESTETAESRFKISKIGKTKLEGNSKLKSKLTKISKHLEKSKSNNTQNKTVFSSENGFTINTDYASYIESAD